MTDVPTPQRDRHGFTNSQKLALAKDDEFQEWIATDKELDRLYAIPRRTPEDRLGEIGLAFGGRVDLGGVYVDPPTIGAVMILATIGSPYLVGKQEDKTLLDVDVFGHVLAEGREILTAGLTVAAIQADASEWCEEAGVDRQLADVTFSRMLAEAFTALEMLPRKGGDKRCLFDLQWYAWMVSTIAPSVGLTADEVGWGMPLVLAVHYMVAENRRQGAELIPMTPNALIMQRMHVMMAEHCQQKGYE